MTRILLAGPCPLPVALFAAGLMLAGCASHPRGFRETPQPGPLPAAGQMAPIPNPVGTAAPHATRREPSPRRPSASQRSNAPRTQAPPKASAAPPPPAPHAAPPTNPARAAQLRAAGLEQLNRGAINRAVALLRRASQLDPGNALIQRDLERAVKISRAVSERR